MARILIIDDEVEVLRSLGNHLKLLGYEVEYAQNPKEALWYIEHDDPFALIVCDNHMGKDNVGIHFARNLRDTHQIDLPVIMHTSDREEHLAEAWDEWDRCHIGYVRKSRPLDPTLLAKKIEETLSRAK